MLNKIILMGRLTRDPELRRTGSGTAVTSFALAVDRDFKGQGGEKETDFIDVVAWRKYRRVCERVFYERPHGCRGRTAVIGLEAEATVAATTTATSSPAEIFPRFPMTTPANCRSDRRASNGKE